MDVEVFPDGEEAGPATPVPRLLHHIWVGSRPIPEQYREYRQSWIDLHPGWEFRVWTDDNLFPLVNQREYEAAAKYVQKSDILRYELIYRWGGVYVDWDSQCLKSFEPILSRGINCFLGEEEPWKPTNTVLGAAPRHPFFRLLVKELPRSFYENANRADREDPGEWDPNDGWPRNIWYQTGPDFLRTTLERYLGGQLWMDHPRRSSALDAYAEWLTPENRRPPVCLFNARAFYPYHWTERHRRDESFPDAFAVHHWMGEWREGSDSE